MLKNVLCLVTALGIVVASYAQEFKDVMRYEYKMTYKPQIEKDIIIEDTTFLDVWDNNSRFATEERVKVIEFLIIDKKNISPLENRIVSDLPPLGQNWVIQKERQNVFSFSLVGAFFFKTEESLNSITWDISSELSDYEGMKVQKATADFGGRLWTVWFTKEIPLMEGPYKFKNLPGFVVKAASADGDYLFEFTKSEKAQTIIEYENYETANVIKKSELKKLREVAANKSMEQILGERGIRLMSEVSSEYKQKISKKQGDSNNYIEKL
ncbi:GLPGLI family protein [Myroides guanonis]|uniref:GLPGLI family protein n=1 Tax=Myroides guanonis TaxID=1150112 RepID=A0A1I3NAF3_9FLAO|nr:GLPGLI family protein [Myroides guanonis]SFJ06303.1 GLPGLI family protein [Myroides guanonis]